MSSVADLSDEAVVIRFRPTSPERVLQSALNELNRTGEHAGISCFAARPESGETSRQVHMRLLTVAELSRIDLSRNPQFYVCSSARLVLALGYRFLKDGYDGELPEHYCIDVGTEPTLKALQELLAVFKPAKVAEVRA